MVNDRKSKMVPSNCVRFLGFIIDSCHMRSELPLDKKLRVQTKCKSLLSKQIVSILEVSDVIGILISVCPAVKYGQLYTRQLEYEKAISLAQANNNYNAFMSISSEGRQD
jgi:hypothetical protein